MRILEKRMRGMLCAALALVVGCQEQEEPTRPGGVAIGGSGTPISGGEGGADSEGQGTVGTVSGDVVQFVSSEFSGTTAYIGSADITITSPAATRSVEVDYDGVDFVAEGEVLGDRWVFVEPVSDGSVYPTITRQDFDESAVSIPLVQRAILDQIFQGLSTSLELSAVRAQLIVRIVDDSDLGVAGVEAEVFGSGAPLISYKEGASWPDYIDATTEDGLIFVPNLEAPSYPGQTIQVVLTGSIEAEFEARLASGAITVVTLVAP